jgi:adenylate cyclase
MSAAPDSTSADPTGLVADLRRQLAERTAERDEALAQLTAMAEVLQVINSSSGDIKPVFDAILGKALDLCDAAFGALSIYEGDHYRALAQQGFSPEMTERFSGSVPISPGSNPGRVRAGEEIIAVADLTAEPPHLRSPGRKSMIELGGARSAIWVALRKDDVAVGFLGAFRQEVSPFTEYQVALLRSFAAQAVIAMENARLIGELRQRTDEVAELNRGLEARVAEQVEELGRVGRLKRFLAPQLAELIVSQGDEKVLESHRREIVVVFCDLRGYTAFTETAEPEEVLEFLRQYHGALGPLVSQFEGTLDQFSGDGIMVSSMTRFPAPTRPSARS